MAEQECILNEDFSSFPIGELPYDKLHTAIGEYHYLPNVGYMNGWTDNIVNYNYRGASWIVTSCDGKRHLEQMRLPYLAEHPHRIYPTIWKGETYWHDYFIKAKLRPLNTHLGGETGICFAMQNTLNTYALLITDNDIRLVYRHKETSTVLKSVSNKVSSDDFAVLSAELDGCTVKCHINGSFLFSWNADSVLMGRVGLTATVPSQFEYVSVVCSKKTAQSIDSDKISIFEKEKILSLSQPSMKLWKKLDIRGFGTGRQIRFGNLLADGNKQIVLAQCQKRVMRDAYCKVSCLTAIDLDGNILWQRGVGSENPDLGLISCDVPLQLYDIDGDGFDEVITAEDFYVLILDGRTGQVKKKALTPLSSESDDTILGLPWNTYAFDRINPDGIRICNFRGLDRPADILIKDRYSRVYALDDNLNLMWKFQSSKNTGHFPYAIDVNGDGKDELFCGYNLIGSDGKLIWTLDVKDDHTDEIIPGHFYGDRKTGTFALASGTQGFIIADYNGKIIVKDGIGHAQRVSMGRYIPGSDDVQICVVNFWGHQSIIYLYDRNGRPIWEHERPVNGNVITPVNWKGDGSDLILLNASPKFGGLMNGNHEIAVRFPDDGHPELCAEAVDITGDARDEIVVWDMNSLWIYTQDDNPACSVCSSIGYSSYNGSNYRGEFHWPDKSWI